MKIETISPYAYRVLDFLSEDHFQYFESLFHKNHLQIYDWYEQIEVAYLTEQYKNDEHYSEFIRFGKVLSRLWTKEFILNSDIVLCRINEWWLINEHIDAYSHIQCVLHMTDWWNNGGDLIIGSTKVTPIKNSLVFFSWNLRHSVSPVLGSEVRMGISFWYNKNHNKVQMHNYYLKKRNENLWF